MTAVYHRPTSIKDAAHALASTPGAIVLAGGTDIYPAHTGRTAWSAPDRAPPIVDISRVHDLHGIEDRGDHWWIGALTTWSDVIAAPLPPLFDGLKAAARDIGGVQIQNRGTIGGNLCTASPAGDSIPCLIALDADIEIFKDKAQQIAASHFVTGYRRTVVSDSGLVTGVRIPKAAGEGYFCKLGARRYLVISIAMVAGVFECDRRSGLVTRARIAVGACAPVAQRLPALEARLIGAPLGAVMPVADDMAQLAPIDDVRASGAYRRAAALQLVADLLSSAAAARGSV